MPTTAAGTAYTVYTTTLTTHGPCYWAVADSHAADANIPTILYCHGSDGADNQFATLSAWSGLRNWVIDNGWAWIEGNGGGPKSWGSDAARAAYLAYLAYVEGVLSIGPKVVLGRSMGGLVSAWLFAQSSRKNDFAGWINNSGVTTMFLDGNDSNGNYYTAAATFWDASMRQAYGITNQGSAGANFAALQADDAAKQRAPENYAASVWAGKKILCCYGTADPTVPWYPRGAKAVRDVWAGQPAVDLTSARAGGDHSSTNGSYLDVTAQTDFLLSVTGGAPPTPPAPSILRVTGQPYMVVDVSSVRSRYAISPKPMEVPPV